MPVPVTPNLPTNESGYGQFTLTIAATGVAEQLSPTPIACSEFAIQIPFGGNQIHIGGPTVTTSTGIELDPPSAGGITPDTANDYIDNLDKVWVIGTIGTVVNVLYRTL